MSHTVPGDLRERQHAAEGVKYRLEYWLPQCEPTVNAKPKVKALALSIMNSKILPAIENGEERDFTVLKLKAGKDFIKGTEPSLDTLIGRAELLYRCLFYMEYVDCSVETKKTRWGTKHYLKGHVNTTARGALPTVHFAMIPPND